MPRLLCAVLVALVARCGGSTAADAPATGLPQVTVDEVAGGKLDLSSLTPGEKPLLVWAWSPI